MDEPAARDRGLTRVIIAASIGNALEFFDFTVFGYFAPQIGAAFFPSADETSSLLLTFGTFGAAFVARPIGAALLGGYADRRGRRNAMTLSILLMTLGTVLLAAMPGYATIGLAAPAGILAGRLIQGFSAGGEFGGATAFMVEHAAGRANFFGSFQFSSQILGSMAGAGLAWALSAAMPHEMLFAWGFRLPFLLGLLIGPVGLYVRWHVEETPDFLAAAPPTSPIGDVLRRDWVSVVLSACLIAAGTAGTYINTYLPTYAQRQLHMSSNASFAIVFFAQVVGLIVTPLAAHFSDRFGRQLIMPAMLGLMALLSYPAFAVVVAHPSPFILAATLYCLGIFRAAYSASAPALMASLFPVATRAVGMSLGYSLGVAVFGGSAGFLLTWLVRATGDPSMPGWYLAACSALSLVALVGMQRRGRHTP